MNSKHILLAFTLISLLSTDPVVAMSEDNGNVEQAESTFKTFKKDIKCAFSRKGCTREQKIRLAKRGLKLLGAVALLYGFLKFRAKVMAKNARMKAEIKAMNEVSEESRKASEKEERRRLAQESQERLARELAALEEQEAREEKREKEREQERQDLEFEDLSLKFVF